MTAPPSRLGALRAALLNNPDYAGAVLSGYAQMAVSALVNMALVPLYLATLGRAGFGFLMVLQGLAAYAAIATLWLTGALTRRLGEHATRGDRTAFARELAAGKRGSLCISLLLGAAGLGTAALWPGLLGAEVARLPELWPGLVLFAAHFVLLWLFSIDRIALNQTGRQTAANLLTILALLVQGVLSALLLLGFGAGLAGATGALLAGTAAGQAGASLLARRNGRHVRWLAAAPAGTGRALRAMLDATGGGFVLYGLLSLTLQADTVIVGLAGGPLLAAEFALVWKIGELITQALWRLADALQPRLIALDVGADRAGLRRVLGRLDRMMLLAAAAAGLGYAGLGPTIVRLWVGAAQAPANHQPFLLAGGAIIWLSIARLPAAAAFVTLRLRVLNLVMAGELAAKLVLIGLLIGRLGAAAPLAATNLVHVLGAAIGYRWLLRSLRQAPAT